MRVKVIGTGFNEVFNLPQGGAAGTLRELVEEKVDGQYVELFCMGRPLKDEDPIPDGFVCHMHISTKPRPSQPAPEPEPEPQLQGDLANGDLEAPVQEDAAAVNAAIPATAESTPDVAVSIAPDEEDAAREARENDPEFRVLYSRGVRAALRIQRNPRYMLRWRRAAEEAGHDPDELMMELSDTLTVMKKLQHFILVSMFLLIMELLVCMSNPLKEFCDAGFGDSAWRNPIVYLMVVSGCVALYTLVSVCTVMEDTADVYRWNVRMQYVWLGVNAWFIIGGACKMYPFRNATNWQNGKWVSLACYIMMDSILRIGKILCAWKYIGHFENLHQAEREQAYKQMPCCQAERATRRVVRNGEIRPEVLL